MHLSRFLDQANIENIRINLSKDGYYIIEEAYDKNFCDKVIQFIDTYETSQGTKDTEINYEGTELRIWNIQKRDQLLWQFYIENNYFISSLLKKFSIASTLLAIRNRPLKQGDELSKKRRWHIDSFRSQLKTFLFLSDTTELSGPFEFVPDTQRMLFKLKMAISGQYFKISDFLHKKARSYQNLNEDLIERIKSKGYETKPIICNAGTLLIVDTSAIHRARPCIKNTRYALTNYY